MVINGYLHLSNFADELKNFFSKYGEVVEHQIIRDHETNRSRGFGFIIFDSEEVVDDLLSKGNMIEMAGTKVSLPRLFMRNQIVNRYLFLQLFASFNAISLLIMISSRPVLK